MSGLRGTLEGHTAAPRSRDQPEGQPGTGPLFCPPSQTWPQGPRADCWDRCPRTGALTSAGPPALLQALSPLSGHSRLLVATAHLLSGSVASVLSGSCHLAWSSSWSGAQGRGNAGKGEQMLGGGTVTAAGCFYVASEPSEDHS